MIEQAYLGSGILLKNVKIRMAKAWAALNIMDVILKSTIQPQTEFLSYHCRNGFNGRCHCFWILTKSIESKQNGAMTRMFRSMLRISWRQLNHTSLDPSSDLLLLKSNHYTRQAGRSAIN